MGVRGRSIGSSPLSCSAEALTRVPSSSSSVAVSWIALTLMTLARPKGQSMVLPTFGNSRLTWP